MGSPPPQNPYDPQSQYPYGPPPHDDRPAYGAPQPQPGYGGPQPGQSHPGQAAPGQAYPGQEYPPRSHGGTPQDAGPYVAGAQGPGSQGLWMPQESINPLANLRNWGAPPARPDLNPEEQVRYDSLKRILRGKILRPMALLAVVLVCGIISLVRAMS